MTESRKPSPAEADVTALWRQMYDQQMETWSKAISDATGTEQFAAALGKQLETYLNAQGVMQKNLQQFMDRSLKTMNLPTRNDVTRLAEQIVALEAKVDSVEEKLDEVLDALARIQSQALVEPSSAPAIHQASESPTPTTATGGRPAPRTRESRKPPESAPDDNASENPSAR